MFLVRLFLVGICFLAICLICMMIGCMLLHVDCSGWSFFANVDVMDVDLVLLRFAQITAYCR